MHQYNCILQQRRGGMENKSSLGGAARWNHFEIFGMKIYFVQEVTRPILVFYSHTCCWLFLPSHFSSLLPFPLLFWKTFNLLCFCPFIPMLHNLSFYNINHFYFKTFYFRSLLYILLPSHLPFHFHFHKCQDLSHFTIFFSQVDAVYLLLHSHLPFHFHNYLDLFPFTKVFSQVDAVYLLLHSHLPPSASPLLPRHFTQGHRQGTRWSHAYIWRWY